MPANTKFCKSILQILQRRPRFGYGMIGSMFFQAVETGPK
jgi:hypothetical protein